MLERKKQQLRNKILSNNITITKEDQCILEIYPELEKELYKRVASDYLLWNQGIYDRIGSYLNPEYITEEIKDNFWFNFVRYYVFKSNEFAISEISAMYEFIDVSEKTKTEIEIMIDKYIKTGELYKKNTHYRIFTEELKTLLDLKRYEEISKIKQISEELSQDILNRLITEFPFDRYDSPEFLGNYLEPSLKMIDKLSIKTLIVMLSNTSSKEEFENHKEEITAHLFQKVKKTRFSDVTEIPELNLITYHVTYEERKKLSEICFNNNILNFIETAYFENIGTEEEVIKKIINYLNNNRELSEHIKNFYLLSEEKIIDALINNGFIEIIFEKDLLHSSPSKIQMIVKNIQEENPLYDRFIQNLKLSYKICNHKEILDAIKNHSKLSVIDFDYEMMLDDNSKEFITKVNGMKNIKIKGYQYLLKDDIKFFFKLFLETHKYEEVITIIDKKVNYQSEEVTDLIEENKLLIIEGIRESLYFAKEILTYIPELIINDKSILKTYIQNEYGLSKLLEYINHHEEYYYFYNEENINFLKEYFSQKYNISEERILKISKIFGPELIRYIENENIQTLLKLEEQDYYKIINLFPKLEYKTSDLEAAYDSIKQYEFSKKYPDDINIFPNILHAIEDNDEIIINHNIERIYKYLDNRFFDDIKEKYNLPEGYDETDPKLFVMFVIEKIKVEQNLKGEKYKELLHHVTDYYITKKREEYRLSYDMISELQLPYELDDKNFETEYTKYLISQNDVARLDYTYDNEGNIIRKEITLREYLINKLTSYGLDEKIIKDCLNYYLLPKIEFTYSYDEETIKKHYKYLIKAVNELSKTKPVHSIFSEETKNNKKTYLDNKNKLKRKFVPGKTDINLYDILTNLRIDIIKDCILHNEDIYISLKQLIEKRKIHILPYCLKNILENSKDYLNLSTDFSSIYGFINYYHQIYENTKSKLASNNKDTNNISFNLIEVLINAEIYSGVSNVYSQILGKEDANLIKANQGPNSATRKIANNGRLKEAVEWTISNYKRQKVTTPTFNEVFELDDKKMRVVVGNFTHPSNLTHGERTGACMRIGGAGETLFEFCLKNENGFHIRFEDPDTGEYISRVSGFRNGNTVFLNELRCSCKTEKYTDEDIIKFCTKASKKIIELSQNSSCPINNVVVHCAYATSELEDKVVNLGVKGIKEGLPIFYTDVNSNAIVLATTASITEFVPINFDKKDVPEYLPAREIPIESTEIEKLSDKITRVDTIKRILCGENYEYIEPINFEKGLIYGIVNQDWYIYVDEMGYIHKDFINLDPRVEKEFEEYLRQVEETYGRKVVTSHGL